MKAKIKFFVPIVIFCFVFLSLYNFSCSHNEVPLLGETKDSPLKNKSSKAQEVQDTFREIYELYKDRVVFISTEQTVKVQQNPFFDDPFFREFFGGPGQRQAPAPRTQKRTGLGSGFIISSDGYICTNYHVVQGVDKVTVKIGNNTYEATVVGSDEQTDIALIKIKANTELKAAFLGNSDTVKVGDWAIAIGNPFGFDKSFTVGVVSATGRHDVDLMGTSMSLIQTDASINPGNSGGPLINIYGEVIGINRMIYSQSGGNIGIGFAIPINTAKSILEQLKVHKKIKRGYIGVQIVPLTEDYAKELGLKDNKGALVGAVVENSPAAKGGLQVGDLIVMINDAKIESYSDLLDIIGKTPIGKSLKIQVIRKKETINLFITVAERP
jgi:serine protease Do